MYRANLESNRASKRWQQEKNSVAVRASKKRRYELNSDEKRASKQGRIQELGAGGGGGGTGEGVAGVGAKLDAEPPRGGCGRGAPLPPS